jgi:mono/diheme cytochrome c family protein
MRSNKFKLLLIVAFIVPIVWVTGFDTKANYAMSTEPAYDQIADLYKKSCAMCHSPKAERHFDLEEADEHHVKAILEGQKAEKPPHMPAYKDKGIDEEKAQALVTYMRQLRAPAGE